MDGKAGTVVRLTDTIQKLRSVITGSGPSDEYEARRLSLQVTSFIRDKAIAAELHEQLSRLLTEIGLFTFDEQYPVDERNAALAILDRIERHASTLH